MNYRWPTVLIAALSLGMVAAIVAPRYTADGVIDWLVFAAVSVLTAAAVAAATHETVDEGSHVRDDVLPPE